MFATIIFLQYMIFDCNLPKIPEFIATRTIWLENSVIVKKEQAFNMRSEGSGSEVGAISSLVKFKRAISKSCMNVNKLARLFERNKTVNILLMNFVFLNIRISLKRITNVTMTPQRQKIPRQERAY